MILPADLIAQFQYALDHKWGYIWGTAGRMWTQSRQDAATRKQTVQYGQRWVGHYVSDCSGLFYWAFKQLGGYMYHGSNTMYDRYCDRSGPFRNGVRADGQPLKPGTALFTGSDGDRGHVGLYIGSGHVIEAAGTRSGVIRSLSSNSKWTAWGELKGVDYSGEAGDSSAPPKGDERPTLKRGSRGETVKALQLELGRLGYDLGPCGADGDFGRATEAAVKAFQADRGLQADGICGPATWGRLTDPSQTAVSYSVRISGLNRSAADALKKAYPQAVVTEERSKAHED